VNLCEMTDNDPGSYAVSETKTEGNNHA